MNKLKAIAFTKYRVIESGVISLDTFDSSLVPSDDWELSIDQSTTCTGIYARSKKLDYHFVAEVKRDREISAAMYSVVLKKFFRKLFSDKPIKRFVYEKPLPANIGRGYHTSKALNELVGMIKVWAIEESFLKGTEIRDINVNSWKSKAMDKRKGKNRYNDAYCMLDDLVDILPNLTAYGNSLGDMDYVDAVGIMIGFDRYFFTEQGERKIAGEEARFGIRCFPIIKEKGQELSETDFSLFYKFDLQKPVEVKFNNDFSLWQNITRSIDDVEQEYGVYTELTSVLYVVNMLFELQYDVTRIKMLDKVYMLMYTDRVLKGVSTLMDGCKSFLVYK
jgi:hypothetical protein